MKNLIILGEEHTFSKAELIILKEKFKTISDIKYNKIDTQEVIRKLSTLLNPKEKVLIVLNTKAVIPSEFLIYLTTLEQRNIGYNSIQSFMENFFFKSYISSEFTDISFLEKIRPYSKIEYLQKRFIDYIVSIPLLIFTLPIMLFAIYKIKKESPKGSILFKQERVGLNGQEFSCVKFRSMKTDLDYKNDYTQENDPRIFPWGDFMRKTRIDELPQLINVLKGDMHLIGPRAEWNKLVKKYQEEIPFYNTRHIVKPGITGWAQVKYKYGANIEDTKEKLMYDLYYIKNWSLLLELKTIWLTVKVILGRKGL